MMPPPCNQDGICDANESSTGCPGDCGVVSVGVADHTCVARVDGTVACWGLNDLDQLGPNGGPNPTATPVAVPGITDAVEVEASGGRTCIRHASGAVSCWGFFNPNPAVVPGLTATAVANGINHVCALLPDSTVACWGSNAFGELGDGTTTSSSTPVSVIGLTNVTAVAAYHWFSCALRSDGTVWCWGLNSHGQLGDGTQQPSSVPVQVSGLTTAVAIAAGNRHACAVLSDGSAACWGNPGGGPSTPSPVPGVASAVSVSAGFRSDCVILGDSTVDCWGRNNVGQLGRGVTSLQDEPLPAPVAGLPAVAELSMHGEHACAVLPDASLRCWGADDHEQLGINQGVTGAVPVAGASNVAKPTGGGLDHNCFALAGGAVSCTGSNTWGKLGNDVVQHTPVLEPVSGLTTAVDVDGGREHNCAALANGEARCWGRNFDGGLGDGTQLTAYLPVSVTGITNATRIAAGNNFSCAGLMNGSVSCWGKNESGELGTGAIYNQSLTPVPTLALPMAQVEVAAGGSQACARLLDGSVYCWGWVYPSNTAVPTSVMGSSNAVAISVSHTHVCALMADATVQCRGSNSFGQFGDGTTTNSTAMVPSGFANVAHLAVGTSFTCAALTNGTVWCAGQNAVGQLGNGPGGSSSVPVQVPGVSNAVAVGVSNTGGCAALANGQAHCWGTNEFGELGAGVADEYHYLPVIPDSL